uniref:DUF1308 domain-containing protein n=2 Tax=Parascaris univalens TaxID=6257 RepID=A0A915AQI0_PARUN
ACIAAIHLRVVSFDELSSCWTVMSFRGFRAGAVISFHPAYIRSFGYDCNLPMRLPCDVLVRRRDSAAGYRRPSKGFIVLAKAIDGAGKSKFEVIVSTSTNRSGVKFLLNNVTLSSIQGRFINDGRVTIQMAEPPVDIFISKAIPDRLKKILALISSIIKGEDVELEVRKQVTSADFVARDMQMSIVNCSQYPVYPSGFPAHLTELTITGIGLRRVDGRWFGLKSLRLLNLRDNLLGEAPDFSTKFLNIVRLQNLQMLILAKNNISNLTEDQWLSFPTSLFVLDIRDNLLTGILPEAVAHLHRLVAFLACGNQIRAIPDEMCRMSSLRVLRLSGNDLQFVPASIRCLRLDFIDLTGNEKLCGPFEPCKHLLTKAAPLLQTAIAYLQNRGISMEGLPWDIQMFSHDETVVCSICKRFSPRDSTTVQHRQLDLSMIAHTVSRGADHRGSNQVLAKYYYCGYCLKFCRF